MCVCVCVCLCVCERVCVCVFCMHTAHHTWGSGYRSGPVFFKSECPWIGDLKFQLPGVGFSVSEFQSHINALRCSGGSECAGVRCVLHRVLQPGWCSNPRERARQRDCDRKMESKKKPQTSSLDVRELPSLPSCDQWHWGLETSNYNGHRLSPPLKPHGVLDAH